MSNLTAETKADEEQNFKVFKDIVDALQPYIKGAADGDGDVIRTSFYDHAHIVGSVDGQFYDFDLDTFANVVTKGGNSPELQHHIAWIDVSGPAAAAKVEIIHWGGNRFTDYFVLYNYDGQWNISGKVYDSHSNN